MGMLNQRINRRSFIKKGLSAAAGIPALSGTSLLSARSFGEENKASAQAPITRKLGKTGVVLPIISMGVMNSDSAELVRAALDRGIVHLDTAHGYQQGRNEEMIGGVLKGRRRDSFFIATKVPGMPRDQKTGLFFPETKGGPFLEKLDLSLQRLGLDYVDILYLHNVLYRESVLFEPLLQAMETARKAGKARFVGVSTHGNEHEVIRAAKESRFYDVVLTGYNFRKQNLTELDQAIEEAADAGLGIIAMKTMGGGREAAGKSPALMKAALKWALQNPHITTAVPGFTTFDQMETDLTVMTDLTLTEEEKNLLKAEGLRAGIYCQGCLACLPGCRENLPIPDLMRAYMYAYSYHDLSAAHDLLFSLDVPTQPCKDCETCTVSCRSGFDVRAKITDIVRLKALPAEFFA